MFEESQYNKFTIVTSDIEFREWFRSIDSISQVLQEVAETFCSIVQDSQVARGVAVPIHKGGVSTCTDQQVNSLWLVSYYCYVQWGLKELYTGITFYVGCKENYSYHNLKKLNKNYILKQRHTGSFKTGHKYLI